MSWFNRLFSRKPADAPRARAVGAPSGPPQTPAVENNVLPTQGTGPVDADLGQAPVPDAVASAATTGAAGPVLGASRTAGTAEAVGEDVTASRAGAETPAERDVADEPDATVEGADAPARGTGAASGPASTSAMTVAQLREQARALGLSGYSRLSKPELIELIAKAR